MRPSRLAPAATLAARMREEQNCCGPAALSARMPHRAAGPAAPGRCAARSRTRRRGAAGRSRRPRARAAGAPPRPARARRAPARRWPRPRRAATRGPGAFHSQPCVWHGLQHCRASPADAAGCPGRASVPPKREARARAACCTEQPRLRDAGRAPLAHCHSPYILTTRQRDQARACTARQRCSRARKAGPAGAPTSRSRHASLQCGRAPAAPAAAGGQVSAGARAPARSAASWRSWRSATPRSCVAASTLARAAASASGGERRPGPHACVRLSWALHSWRCPQRPRAGRGQLDPRAGLLNRMPRPRHDPCA